MEKVKKGMPIKEGLNKYIKDANSRVDYEDYLPYRYSSDRKTG